MALAVLWWLALLSLVLIVARRSRAGVNPGASEETAHRAALVKRMDEEAGTAPNLCAGSCPECLRSATAINLGGPESVIPCQVVYLCASSMLIRGNAPLPAGSQIEVRWGKHVFVGAGHLRRQRGRRRTIALRLISCNYVRTPWRCRIGCLANGIAAFAASLFSRLLSRDAA